jgi:hypothetical protein
MGVGWGSGGFALSKREGIPSSMSMMRAISDRETSGTCPRFERIRIIGSKSGIVTQGRTRTGTVCWLPSRLRNPLGDGSVGVSLFSRRIMPVNSRDGGAVGGETAEARVRSIDRSARRMHGR